MTLNTQPDNNQLAENMSEFSTFLALQIDGVVISIPNNAQISSHIDAFWNSIIIDIATMVASLEAHNMQMGSPLLGEATPVTTEYSEDN